jgi:hypothetical protein
MIDRHEDFEASGQCLKVKAFGYCSAQFGIRVLHFQGVPIVPAASIGLAMSCKTGATEKVNRPRNRERATKYL